jgi:hypothetical protein
MNRIPFEGKFNSLVGLSPVAPNCQQENLTTAQITTADSGVYLTDIDSLNLSLTEAVDDCGNDSLWQILAAGRKNALQQMEIDLLAAFEQVNTKRLEPFRGLIGSVEGMGYVQGLTEGQLVTITLHTRNLPGAFLRITKMGLSVSHDVDVDVSVPGNSSPIMIVCSANTTSYTTLSEPLLVPLDGQPYSFSYTIAGFRPKANKLNCDCGGQQARINQYVSGLVDTPAFGLMLIAEAGCNVLEAVYDAAELEPVKQSVLAVSLRYLALKFAIERIINSGMINRFTMMGLDELYDRRKDYTNKYEQRIMWLASTKGIDLSNSACYTCLPTQQPGIKKKGILS